MKNDYKILIVDDHQIIVDAYKNSINNYLPEYLNYNIIIDSSNDCESALNLLNKPSNQQKYNLVLLDINFPNCKNKITSGEELGVVIRKKFPNIKIIVITTFKDNYRIYNILRRINPDGFLLKNDIDSKELCNSVESVIVGRTVYSKSIIELIRKKITNFNIIDDLDLKILLEISNGTKTIHLTKYIPLSKAGIEKRKRILKHVFEVSDGSDRELILRARKKGFI